MSAQKTLGKASEFTKKQTNDAFGKHTTYDHKVSNGLLSVPSGNDNDNPFLEKLGLEDVLMSLDRMIRTRCWRHC